MGFDKRKGGFFGTVFAAKPITPVLECNNSKLRHKLTRGNLEAGNKKAPVGASYTALWKIASGRQTAESF
jgi:hypothetical protein